MKGIKNQSFSGERAEFFVSSTTYINCRFHDGESPLKEGSDLKVISCCFEWKYPLWYCKNIEVKDSTWKEYGRAGVWYCENASFNNCLVNGPKNFRRCKNLKILSSTIPSGVETLWECEDVEIDDLYVQGDYFAMNCKNMKINKLIIDGNYPFDGAKHVYIKDSVLMSKDSFWNTEDITLENCKVVGEYFGWNSKRVTLINCDISSIQGFCYMDDVKLINCRLKGTTLSFEYVSNVDAEIVDEIDSIKNPISGKIKVKSVKELILEEDKVDLSKTKIEVIG